MMAWRRWMTPLLIGAALGAVLTMALAGIPHKDTLAVVLLVVQIPILIWDVVVTTRLLRRQNRETEEMLRHMAAAQKRWWN